MIGRASRKKISKRKSAHFAMNFALEVCLVAGTSTLSVKEQLQQVELQLAAAEARKDAEEAYRSVNGDSANPFAGATEHYKELALQVNDLRVQEKGHALNAAIARLRELDLELDKAQQIRQAADRMVAEMRVLPLIIRYTEAFALSRNLGHGYSFVLFDEWYRKNKPRTSGAPDCLTFFESAASDPRLKFNLEDERKTILEYLEARGRSENALIHWTALVQMRSALLREKPELLEIA